MEKKTFENALNNYRENYDGAVIKNLIADAYNAIDAYIFPTVHSYETSDEVLARIKKERENYANCGSDLNEARRELEEISATLSHTDYCEEISDEECEKYFSAMDEVNELLDTINEAMDCIDDAKAAYRKLHEALSDLEYLA